MTRAVQLVTQFAQRRPAMIGIYTAYVVRHMLWFILVVWLALIAAVTAIDIAPEITRVWSRAAGDGPSSALLASARFVFLRILDNGSQVLPIAIILGSLSADVALAASGRLTTARSAGMLISQRLRPVICVAVMAVGCQLTFDNVVRPYAFMSLSLEGLGEYGWRYERNRADGEHWNSFGGTIMQARLRDDPGPIIEDVTLYTFEEGGRLREITHAARLSEDPDSRPGNWLMHDVYAWSLGEVDTGAAESAASVRHFEFKPLGFEISGLWLQYRYIDPKYVPIADLARLASETGLPETGTPYREWLHIRLLQAFATGAIVVTVATVFAFLLDARGLLLASGAALAAAYLGYLATRIANVLAENALFPPVLILLALPCALCAVSWTLSRRILARDAPP